MTPQRDLDDVLRAWVDEGDERLPQHNLQGALAAIETTAQRGARWALLKEFIMRMQPAAPILGIAAAAILAAALYLALGQNVGGPERSPSPSPASRVSGEYQTATFNAPLTIDMAGGGPDGGWFVRETDSAITISSTEATAGLRILDGQSTSVVGADGSAQPIDAGLAAALDELPGVTAELGQAFDRESPQSYPFAGEDAEVTVVEVDESASGRALLRTSDGIELSLESGASWWVMRRDVGGADLVAILAATPDSSDPFSGSYLRLLESVAVR